jgi:LPPG:FO 2-phospho-L-lactate transferase
LKVLLLAGGTGSSKLIRGLMPLLEDFSVIANVGDNVRMHGLYVCPDLDIAMYTLAGIIDQSKNWGVERDSYSVLEQLGRLGEQRWFTLGDRDLATHILRTELLGKGMRLTQVTKILSAKLGVRHLLLPPTDDHVETRVITATGDLHLQEFWVRDRGADEVQMIRYDGIEKARATTEVVESILDTDRIIFCPANPVTSIMPILNIPGIRQALVKTAAVRVALSPFVGDRPFSGPAGKFMSALGMESSSVALTELYKGMVDRIVIDSSDEQLKGTIEARGVRCTVAPTAMPDEAAKTAVARLLLQV